MQLVKDHARVRDDSDVELLACRYNYNVWVGQGKTMG
jgi:hypothetical protein